MLVEGVKEWFGEEGKIFIDIRNAVENTLLSMGFDYFYSGIISKKSLYQNHVSNLGPHFLDNCLEFDLNGKKTGNIISPEGTFRVYDYLDRNSKLKKNNSGKIFYSQEFARNESQEEIREGKTMSFWQSGFEIYGFEKIKSSILAIETVYECFKNCNLPEMYIRISDKRLIEGLLITLPLEERRNIYQLIDKCGEDGNKFYETCINEYGNKKIAEIIKDFLNLTHNKSITLDMIDKFTDNEISHQGVIFLKEIFSILEKDYPQINIKLIPFMPKSWDACDTLLFDARLPKYNYAVAGGGNLSAFNKNNININKSGAGIGITRLVEYILNNN